MRHFEMTTLSEEQAQALLEAAIGNRFEALYVLALATGMRQGELLALRWRDVDLEARTLQVRATLQKDTLIFAEPKTPYSRRRIALSQTAVEALRRHHVLQAEERRKMGSAWTDLGLVFPNTVGQPMDCINLLKHSFRPLLRAAGLAADAVSRLATHSRDPPAGKRDQSQDRVRDARTFADWHHTWTLQPCDATHATTGCE